MHTSLWSIRSSCPAFFPIFSRSWPLSQCLPLALFHPVLCHPSVTTQKPLILFFLLSWALSLPRFLPPWYISCARETFAHERNHAACPSEPGWPPFNVIFPVLLIFSCKSDSFLLRYGCVRPRSAHTPFSSSVHSSVGIWAPILMKLGESWTLELVSEVLMWLGCFGFWLVCILGCLSSITTPGTSLFLRVRRIATPEWCFP